jgi:putative flavoprotein involved in K+ transport
MGLPWLYTWGSGRFSGVGRDAEHVVEQITALRAEGSSVGVETQMTI